MNRPRVRIYNEVSLDGRVTGFTGDGIRYYRRAFRWRRDAILVGSATAQAFGPAETDAERIGPGPDVSAVPVPPGFENLVAAQPKPLLVVVDSGGVVHNWRHAQAQPWYAGSVTLVSSRTGAPHRDYLARRGVTVIEAGADRVDLAAALEVLADRFGVSSVIVDGGGALNGALLSAGVVDEVVMILSPRMADRESRPFVEAYTAPVGGLPVRLTEVERLDDGALWLAYEVVR